MAENDTAKHYSENRQQNVVVKKQAFQLS